MFFPSSINNRAAGLRRKLAPHRTVRYEYPCRFLITPRPGTIVICDYTTGFRAPEMIKRRLAVTISPKLKRRDALVTIVPLSMSAPAPVEPWHVEVPDDVPDPWGPGPRWAKCDMVATVGYARLNLPHSKHQVTGVRQYHQIELDKAQVEQLRRAVSAAIGIVIEP